MAHTNSMQSSVTLSVRLSTNMCNQSESLADATNRTKSFLAAEAIGNYLKVQEWQIKATKQALEKANSPNANFICHDKVVEWFKSV